MAGECSIPKKFKAGAENSPVNADKINHQQKS